MNERERVHSVQLMLFALSSLRGRIYELSLSLRRNWSRLENGEERTVTTYAIQGHQMCKNGFSAVVQISDRPIVRHASQTASTRTISSYTNNHGKHRQGLYHCKRLLC